MRYWWVNQNQTHHVEIQGGFLWSPKTNKNGARNPFYDSMLSVEAGDLVFSFVDQHIGAIGVVQRKAYTAPKPEAFGNRGDYWNNIGWLVEVEFAPNPRPFRPKDIIDELRPLLAEKYAPIRSNGNGLQGVYLTEISEFFAAALLHHTGISEDHLVGALLTSPSDREEPGESLFREELPRDPKQLQGDLERLEVSRARRGQGVFKHNVRLIERHCRMTGVSEVRHLRASHIKPWSRCDSPDEKLDGANGLLLSPHVDHLFDQGFVSFKSDGSVLVSQRLEQDILSRWSLDRVESVGSFTREQDAYLEFHRDEVFA